MRELIDVLQNVIDDFMTNILIALQDLTESKLKFVENQFISEHDDVKDHDAKNFSAKHSAKDLTENLAKNFKRNHFDDDNISL